jgi:glutaredoxin 2
VETVQKHFPKLKIFARAVGRVHAYEYQKRGVLTFYRETVGSSLELGVDVLREFGMPETQARRAALIFKQHDEESVRQLAQYWEDDDAYFKNARQHIEAFERMFASDAARSPAGAEQSPQSIVPGEA